MIAKPMGLAALNQFPQRAERIIPFGAARGAPPAAIARSATAGLPHPVAAPPMGGIHSLAPRMGPQPFKGMPGPMKFASHGMKR